MPFFSVIIPTYNSKVSLLNAINSVLSQTYTDFEILIIDDGSTDGTEQIVEKIYDERISYELQKNSGGPANPRNKGISKATGDWVCFLDADDYWSSEKLEVCYDEINQNVDFIFHDLFLIGDNKNAFKKRKLKGRDLSTPIIEDLLINGNPISTSSVMIRRSILENLTGFDENNNVIAAEDFKFWMQISTKTQKFKYLNKTLGYYLDLGMGISSKNMSSVYFNAINSFLPLLNNDKLNRALSFPKYINAKFISNTPDFNSCKNDLIFCIKYSKLEFKIKSTYLLIKIFMKQLKKHFS